MNGAFGFTTTNLFSLCCMRTPPGNTKKSPFSEIKKRLVAQKPRSVFIFTTCRDQLFMQSSLVQLAAISKQTKQTNAQQ